MKGARPGAPALIVGIGSDLCDIERIEKTLARYGERFIDRCFTETEQRRSDRRAGRAASYAKRFAAKEACAKALGTGLRRGVFWRDMGVVNLPSGQPTMQLTGRRRTAESDPAARDRAVHPPDDHRRARLRPGVRGHRGPPCPFAARKRRSARVSVRRWSGERSPSRRSASSGSCGPTGKDRRSRLQSRR